jgi:SAM-dependent methyltransferase
MTIGRFDRDSAALTERLRSHELFGSRDVNDWIFAQLRVQPGHRVLELGCGTGKQTLPLAERVGRSGSVLAVDISEEALGALSREALARGVDGQILPCRVDLDHLADEIMSATEFDRALGSFSLYYAHDPARLFVTIYRHLTIGGLLFFCGPSRKNNAELRSFHDSVSGHASGATAAALFMEDDGPRYVRELFADVSVTAFENPLRFESATELYRYWSSYYLYDDRLDDAFRAAGAEFFANHDQFVTVKRVIGVTAVR